MTQEELYWYEKRLRLKADEEERKIREKYEIWIRHSKEAYQTDSVFSHKCRPPFLLKIERDEEIEFVRLEILEPVLDEKDRNRLQQLREERKRRAEEEERRREEERKRREEEAERKRKELEEEERRREEERKRREEEAERKRKRLEELKRKRAEQEKEKAKQEREEREERKRRIKTALLWILGTAVVGAIIAAIIITN